MSLPDLLKKSKLYLSNAVAGAAAAYVSYKVGLSIDDLVTYDTRALEMRVNHAAVYAVDAAALLSGVLGFAVGPRVVRAIKDKAVALYDRQFSKENEDARKAGRSCLVSALVGSIALAGAMTLGWKYDAPLKPHVIPFVRRADSFMLRRRDQVERNERLLERYSPGTVEGVAKTFPNIQMIRRPTIFEDLPPRDLEAYAAWFAKKYCERVVPSHGCGDVWDFIGLQDGEPVYRTHSYQASGKFYAHKGKVFFERDAISPRLGPPGMVEQDMNAMFVAPPPKPGEHLSHGYVVGDPRMRVRKHEDGYELVWPDFREFLGNKGGAYLAIKGDSRWVLLNQGRETTVLGERWWKE